MQQIRTDLLIVRLALENLRCLFRTSHMAVSRLRLGFKARLLRCPFPLPSTHHIV